jgi:Mg/Co/Ni transporter MgtE
VIQGARIDDLIGHLTELQEKQHLHEKKTLLEKIDHWTESQLADELGNADTATLKIELFADDEPRLLQAIAAKHRETLRAWSNFGGKKGRAHKIFSNWCETYGNPA